ncbi:MAG: cyclic pyranopterin monophosphate synthase MoaC [Coprothermobacter sp.]|nr:cyclic pyranopterin monophosphate synthase MoaC [Coprothermobacter sp.]
MGSNELTHLDDKGNARMIDVGGKLETAREAVARCRVLLAPATFELVKAGNLKKGDVLTVAQVAGIQAAKRTWELIPLCHQITMTFVGVTLTLNEPDHAIDIEATARTKAETGVEMEALVAASTAALTVYDMCKAVERGIRITDLRLVRKSGGQSGLWEGA